MELEGHNLTATTACGQALALAGLGDLPAAAAVMDRTEAAWPREGCVRLNQGLRLGLTVKPGLAGPYGELQRALGAYRGGVGGWRAFLGTEAAGAYGRRDFRGKAVLIVGNARRYLAMALRSMRVLREAHGCDWPLEYWTEAGELHLLSRDALDALEALGATLRVLPSPQAAWEAGFWDWRPSLSLRWGQRPGSDIRLQKYALKPLALLLSGCEECLLLDADSLPLRPPQDLAGAFPGRGAAVWPDLWDCSGARGELWEAMRLEPGQRCAETGQLWVRKGAEGVRRALLLAALFAVRADVFLGAIYGLGYDGDGGLACGYGDKDAFHLALGLSGADFARAAPLPSILLDRRGAYVGLLQPDGAGRPLFLHALWAKERAAELLLSGQLRRCYYHCCHY